MMSLENAFIEQLAQYIEINYKEYLPVTDENILYEKYAPFVDIPERKEQRSVHGSAASFGRSGRFFS